MRKFLLALLLLLGTLGSYAQSNLSVFSTNPDNSYIDGETLTWTVMITNNGPLPANNVRAFYAVPSFLLPLPPGITKFWWSKENAVPATGGTNTPLNNITPILGVGQTVSYTLHVKVPTDYTGTIPQLEVSYTKSADLEVVNTNNQTIYTPGTQVTYNVTVTNHGPEVADPVSIAMPIPAGITSFSWTGSNGSSGTNAALANNIGVMAVNQVVTYTVTVDIPAAFTGALTTQASVASPNTVDPVPGCTQCTDTDTSLQDADVVLVNTNNQSVYTAGGTTVYILTVTNNGPAAATNVVVTDTFPAGAAVSWVGSNGSSGTGSLNNAIGTLALNQTVTYTLTVGVPAGYNAATFISQAAVTSDKDPVTACTQCTDTDINPATAADIVVTNTDGQTTYTPGSTVVYTLTVANSGPNAALNVHTQMAIPAGITQFSWQGTNGSAGTNAPVNNTQNSLPNGTSIVYTITVVVPATFQGDLVTQAVVTSNNDPTPACTQCIDVDTSTTPTANIVVTNTDGIEIYTPGTNNTYTVTVTNNGPYPASNVVVSNPVPAGITAFVWTGSNASGGTGALTNTIPTMAVGQTITYTITLGVPAGYTGNLSSVTTVTSSTSDPVTTDNTVADVDSDVASADLVVTKTLNQGATYTAGADAIYTITVKNQGPTVAQNVSVTDAIPVGLTAANATWYGSNGTTGTGNLADVVATLPAGQQVTYTLTIPVPSNYSTTANIVNQVVVTSDTPDPNPACPGCTHTATPNPQANIVTWKTNGQTEYFANAQTVYTIVVTNPGPSDAINVVVHDSKPYNVDLMTWSGNSTGGAGTLHNVIPVLAAGQTVEYTVTVSVKANHPNFVGNLTNVVTVTSDTPDPVPACPGCTDVDTPRVKYVTVDQNAYTTEELVNDVLINTDCINVSNIIASAGDINGNYGIGYFNRNNAIDTSFPIKDGIIIRNGHAKFSEGKYTDQNLSSTASGLLDPELSLYAPGNETMNDVSYLQFEFVPLSNEMSFDFLFAANEYGFYQCGWYDTFAFILKDLTDTTIPPKNCAVIPGSNTPVSVGTIRKQIYNTACADMNPTYFYQYNVTEPGLSNSSINHRGQTIKMQASAVVVPGHLYSIKMAVGDRGDTAFDSAVFLAAGSFNIGQPTLPSDFTIGEVPGNSAALCPGEEHVLSAQFSGNTNFILRWEKDGVELTDPVSGAPLDTPSITINEPGIYTLKAAFPSDPTCFLTDDIKVEYRPEIEVADPINLVVCGDPAQLHAFNLQTNDPIMKAPLLDPDFIEIEYYHSQEEIENGLPKIPNSEAANYMGYDGEVIYVGAVGYDFPCYTIRQFTLRIHDCEIEMEPYAVHVCEPAPYDGVETFDLTSYTDEMTVIDPIPAGYVYTFYNNQTDAEGASNPIAGPEAYSGTTETVWVRAQDESVTDVLVYGVAPLTLIVDPQPEIGVYNDESACGSYILTAPAVGSYFTGVGGTGTQIDPTVPLTATQTVYVYAQSGTAPDVCSDETSFVVTIYPAPVVAEIADLEACDAYELQPLTTGNYYTGAGGTGTMLAAGTPITTTQTIYIYAVTGDATNVCSDESDFVVTINSAPVVSPATPLEVCADNFDGFAYFDLTQAGTEILNGQTGLTITYHETELAAQNGVSAIPTPANYHSISGIVYASVIQTGTTTSCRTVVPIQLIVSPRPAVPVMSVYALCDDDTDGFALFDLTTKNGQATGGNTGLTVTYHLTQAEAQDGQNAITPDTAFTNTTANQQQIWVRVATGFGCRSVAPLTLRVNPLPVLNPDPNAFIATECEEVPGQGEFHLEEIAAAVIGGAPSYSVTFYETLAEALDGTGTPLSTPYLSNAGFIYARIVDDITGCFTTHDVELRVIPAPIATPPAPIEECDFNNDGYAKFDMTAAMDAIEAALGDVEVTAYETQEDADNNVNAIPNPENYTNVDQHVQTIYLRVQSTLTDCYDMVTLQLIVNPVPIATIPSDYALCDDGASDLDGIATFNLSTKTAEVLGTLDPSQYSVSYHTTQAAATAGTPSITNVTSYTSATATIYVRVTNTATGCFAIVPLELIVNPLPSLITNESVYTLCDTTEPSGKEIFDLTSKIGDFIADASGMDITFHRTVADAQAKINAITTPAAYENEQAPVQTLVLNIMDAETGCFRIAFLDIRVEHQPIILPPAQDELTVCDTNGQGIGVFDLEALVAGMINGDPDIVITFHESYEDAQSGANAIPDPQAYMNSTPYLQSIYVRAVDTRSGCSNTIPYELILTVEPAPQAPGLADLTFCDDQDNNNSNTTRVVNLTVQNQVIADALGIPVSDIPTVINVEYYTTSAGANSGLTGRITTPSAYNGTNGQVIWVRVENPDTECYSVTSFKLIINAPIALTIPTMLVKCNEALPNDSQTEFDLTVKEDEILGINGVGQGAVFTYYPSPGDAAANTNAIGDPTAYVNTPAPPSVKTLGVKVTTKEGCVSFTTLTIKVLPLPTPDTTPDALVSCDDNGNGDGTEIFDLTQAQGDISDNGDYEYTYFTSEADANANENPIADPANYTSGSGFVWVRVVINTGNAAEPLCAQAVQLELIVNPLPPIADLNSLAHCEQGTDGADTFNLPQELTEVLEGQGVDPADFDIDFFSDAALTTPAVPLTAYPVTGGQGTVYVRVENLETGCQIVKELTLYVEEAATANPVTDRTECDYEGANDGFITWDLTPSGLEALGTQSPADYSVSYYETAEDAAATPPVNAIADPAAYVNSTADTKEIWVVVTNTSTVSGCNDITSFILTVERLAEPVITGENGSNTVCIDFGDTEGLLVLDSGVVPNGHSYEWFKDGVSQGTDASGIFAATTGGVYTVVVTSAAGCESAPSAGFTVIESGQASAIDRGYYVTNYFSDNQTITITVQGNGEYEYQLDNGPRQDSPVFTNVSPGVHKVTVYDVKTGFPCDALELSGVSVVDYPNFFTPNGDGFHDTWNIIGLQNTGAVIYIFDRYGKLIKQISPDLESDGWDGTFNGAQLPADDYWFSVTYPEFNGTNTVTKEFKAHFSLKR